MDLKSTVSKQGKYVTQVIHGVHGTKGTIENIDTSSIIEGQFVKMWDKSGRLFMVNPANVLYVEVFKE